ncbi:MAG TPA: HNH endonuclease signature motif containing protein [bacterium]|nr:HNH endonuclease signature motif containing protein [bacterium]
MEIASVRVHRIVATAFHGEAPSPQHVVDHIDTNRRNNRPENLRWLTKLENVLQNPLTVKRIEYAFGSIDNFLNTPPEQRRNDGKQNFSWMRPVNPKEARTSYQRLLDSAENDKPLPGGPLGEWVFHKEVSVEGVEELSEEIPAITLNAVQRKWRTPCEFLCCPEDAGETPISSYAQRLTLGCVFSRNEFQKSIVEQFAVSQDGKSLWVMCCFEGKSLKPWTLAQVTFEDGQFVHTNLGSFFGQDGAEKQYCLAQGKEWTGGDTFDDFC